MEPRLPLWQIVVTGGGVPGKAWVEDVRERALGCAFCPQVPRAAKTGYPLLEDALQFILLLVGFLELGEDAGQEALEAGQQLRLVLLQLQPQLLDITLAARKGKVWVWACRTGALQGSLRGMVQQVQPPATS